MPGPQLRIGPTHALRVVLAKLGNATLDEIVRSMNEEGVSPPRATRALRRACGHGQVQQDAAGRFYLTRRPDSW